MKWFGFSGYPEIICVAQTLTADTRPGHFVRKALGADVVVGNFKGLVCLAEDDPQKDDLQAVIDAAKRCVEYQREKQSCSK